MTADYVVLTEQRVEVVRKLPLHANSQTFACGGCPRRTDSWRYAMSMGKHVPLCPVCWEKLMASQRRV